MKKSTYLTVLVVIFTLFSCKTIPINQEFQKIADRSYELGYIGTDKLTIINTTFEVKSIPNLNSKIRVSATIKPFTKLSFNGYLKALKLQGKKATLKYIDSLPIKPKHVTFELLDKVTLISELNSIANKETFEYLKIDKDPKIITVVSGVFDSSLMNQLQIADVIFLNQKAYKKYQIQLYKNQKLIGEFNLSDGTIFSYSTNRFCWGTDTKHHLKLMNLIPKNNKCSKGTSANYQTIKKEKYKLKF